MTLEPDRIVRRGLVYAFLGIVLLLGSLPLHRSTWHGNAELHTLLETISTLLAIITGAMALVRYYTEKSSMYLLLGNGFLGAALLDGYHAAVTSTFLAGSSPSALSALTKWSGAPSRVYLSLLLCASLVVWKRESRRPTAVIIREGYVYLFVGIWTVVVFLFFAFVPLPLATYPNWFITHPVDLVQSLFFAVATVGYLWKGSWRTDDFEAWLVASLVVETVGHLAYLSSFHQLFDSLYMSGHVLKILQYVLVFVGLFISMHTIFKREAESAKHLSEANRSLATEVVERQRVAKELLEAHDGLELRVKERTQELSHANEELAHEIAGRKLADEELRQTSELVMLLLGSAPEAIYGQDIRGICTFTNPSCLRLLGYHDDKELLGKNMHALLHHTRADGTPYPERQCRIVEAFQTGTHAEDEVFWRRDGTSFPAEYWSRPIHKSDKAIGTVVTFVDITERKQVEQSLREAKKVAEDASRVKSEFLANMSHEIRTPMNGIIGMTELALDTDLSEEQRGYLDMVSSSADSLLALINDILDFSKIEAGKLDIEQIEFNLRDTVDAAMKTINLRAHQKGLELACHVLPDVPDTLKGDPSRLRQVVLNLVGNAIKFTSHGEVVLRVESEQEEEESVVLHFSVTDTGVGIPREKQETIFEAFTQADSSMTRKYGGTGLGLAICSRIVDLMGGRIWVESEHGRGSTFHFNARFNLQSSSSARSEPIGVEMLRDLPALVVDDNATSRRILEETLLGWGMKPTLSEDGRRGLATLEQLSGAGRPCPLILLDAQMPELNGFSVAEAIRQDPRHSESVIIMLTSAGMRGDAARCRELGIEAYLPKPVKQSDLLEAIKMALGSHQESQESLPVITRHSLRESRGRLRILLADDNAVNQTLAVRLLEKRGYTVVVANTGKLALEALETQSFDLVLMDVQMPEMNGLEATAAIRFRERTSGKHIPIIAMTAHAMVGHRELCLKAGMDGYVTKPIQPGVLFAAIEDLLRIPMAPSTA
jgi:PAS domain S-box-containing protein